MLRNVSIAFALLAFLVSLEAVFSPLEEGTNSVLTSMMVVQQTATDVDEPSDFVLFIGRFHPLIVHLPIGFLLMAFLLEFFARYKKFEQLKYASPFVLLLGALSAIAAAIAGYLLSLGGGYGEDLLVIHQWLGIAVAVLSLAAFVIRIKFFDEPVLKKIYGGVLVLMLGTLLAAGHYGGSLTHGSDYLTRYMPDPLRTIAGLPPKEEKGIKKIVNIDSALVFEDIIHPIFDTRCVSCHNPEKKKGELLLTSFDKVMEGGESGPVLEAGSAENSEVVKRLLLPESDEDHMPPDGKRQLTDDQVDLIAWWIDQGAPMGKKVAQLQVPEDISGALKKLTDEGKSFLAKTDVPKADKKTIEDVRKQGFKVYPIARGKNFLQVSFSGSADSIGSEHINSLVPLSQQITWLDLGRTGVEDGDLSKLSAFKNLTRLNLEHTAIGDSTLNIVSSLEHLEYLNVYATGISDEGLQYLEGSKSLKSLYVWQTKVTSEGVRKLNKQLPELYVNTGWENDYSAKQKKNS